jgi:thiol-disulfide isomerase/thioredoxin
LLASAEVKPVTYLALALVCLGLALASGPARAAGVGEPAPNCALTELGGDARRELDRHRGDVVYVDFWATWCGRCLESFAFLDGLDRELGARGLSVIGVNLDEDPREARAFLAKHPVRFAQTTDDTGSCPREFGVQGMPAAYLIDRRGVIRWVHLGFRHGERDELRARVVELLEEPK